MLLLWLLLACIHTGVQVACNADQLNAASVYSDELTLDALRKKRSGDMCGWPIHESLGTGLMLSRDAITPDQTGRSQ